MNGGRSDSLLLLSKLSLTLILTLILLRMMPLRMLIMVLLRLHRLSLLLIQSLAQALTRPDAVKWKEAAQKEFDDLIANGSWEYCQLPSGAKAIGCRWVFMVKYHADGSVDRYKARLVAKGFS